MIEFLILLIAGLLALFSARWPLPEISKRFTLMMNVQVALMIVITLIASKTFDSGTAEGVRNFQIVMRVLIGWLALLAATLCILQIRHALRTRSTSG